MNRALTQTGRTRRLIVGGSVLLLALLTLIGTVVWHDNRPGDVDTASATDVQLIGILRPEFPDIILRKGAGTTAMAVRNATAGAGATANTDADANANANAVADADADALPAWTIIEPCELPANPQRLHPLLDALTPSAHSYAAADVDLDTAGLTHPEAVIELDGQRLLLGRTDLSGDRRYARNGDRVQFVPEWVLSLVEGGLSALASLDIFPQPLTGLEVKDAPGNDGELADWQALTAVQIVTWPLQDGEQATASHELLARFGDYDGQARKLALHVYPSYAALRYENAQCAYILPVSSLPDSVRP